MTLDGADPACLSPTEPRTPAEQPRSAEDGDLAWPVATSLGQYLSCVDDVAARFTGLPVEHVIRALRQVLRGLDEDEELIYSLGRRISNGQLPIR